MYSTRLVQLMLLALAVVHVAEASWWSAFTKGSRDLNARQIIPIIGGDEETTTDPGENETTEGAPDPTNGNGGEETTTTTRETSSAADPTTRGNDDPSTSSTTSVNDPEQTSSSSTTRGRPPVTTTSTTRGSQQTSASEETTRNTNTPVVSTSYHVVTKTNSNGDLDISTSTSLTTTTPDLNEESGETSGMSPQTRNTVIGVVVGIGGAIVLGALGLVAWRIWGRKKRIEETDGLMDYNNQVEKNSDVPPGSAPGSSNANRSPFQSTLENYHQPTQVNASSNF